MKIEYLLIVKDKTLVGTYRCGNRKRRTDAIEYVPKDEVKLI